MRKIEFGYSNSLNPTGSWEGIGISNDLFLTAAEYYGAVAYEGDTYLVAKNIKDENNLPEKADDFIVRDALVDMYADGSGIILLNQEESLVSKQLEDYLNSEEMKGKVKNISDIINLIEGVGQSPKSFKIMEKEYENNSLMATAIVPEVFAMKNEAIKNCQRSFSDMQMQLEKEFSK